nr:unnamed protein product [Callosobruchus analis]
MSKEDNFFTDNNTDISSHEKAGIHPLNPDVFSDEDFLCSAVTDRDCPQRETTNNEPLRLESHIVFGRNLDASSSQQAPENVETVPVQDDTSVLRENIEGLSGESSSTSSEIVLPAMIRSYPKAPPRKMFRRGRQPGKTKILTITPEKENIHIGCPTEIPTTSTSCEVMEHTQSPGLPLSDDELLSTTQTFEPIIPLPHTVQQSHSRETPRSLSHSNKRKKTDQENSTMLDKISRINYAKWTANRRFMQNFQSIIISSLVLKKGFAAKLTYNVYVGSPDFSNTLPSTHDTVAANRSLMQYN